MEWLTIGEALSAVDKVKKTDGVDKCGSKENATFREFYGDLVLDGAGHIIKAMALNFEVTRMKQGCK